MNKQRKNNKRETNAEMPSTSRPQHRPPRNNQGRKDNLGTAGERNDSQNEKTTGKIGHFSTTPLDKRSQQISQGGESQQQQQRRGNSGYKQPNRSFNKGQTTKCQDSTACDNVQTNYLKLNLSKMPDVAYHYDVKIKPDTTKKWQFLVVEKFNSSKFPQIAMAYDGTSNLYTVERLDVPIETEIELHTGSKLFQLSIQATDNLEINMAKLKTYSKDTIDNDTIRALQCLQIMLLSAVQRRGVRAGRSFYMPPKESFNLGDGMQMWWGLYQAVVMGDQLLLNVDITHKSFPQPITLVQYIRDKRLKLDQPLNDFGIKPINYFLRGLKIVYTPPQSFGAAPRVYTASGLSMGSAARETFRDKDGKSCTIADYYQSRGSPLKYPNFNCVVIGSSVKRNYLPVEFCSIERGQTTNRNDSNAQENKLIGFATTTTNKRKQRIEDLIMHFAHNCVGVCSNARTCLNYGVPQFGIQFGIDFINVPVRLLRTPQLQYANAVVNVTRGAWNVDDQLKFLKTKKPPQKDHFKWAIMYQNENYFNIHNVDHLANTILSSAKSLNMSLSPTKSSFPFTDDTFGEILIEKDKESYDLLFIMVPTRGIGYDKIKTLANKCGILTQCIKVKNLDKVIMNINNLMGQVNVKLNGCNYSLVPDNAHKPLENVMYLGGDVTHPSPNERRSIPSVVGLVASHDLHGMSYNSKFRAQPPTVEIIQDMKSMCLEHLKTFYRYQNRYPEHILYYRDGVSDGQFDKIIKHELREIKSACKALKLENTPKLTCLICVKRHHTNFYHKKECPAKGYNNVSPGTVVDQVIVHPQHKEYYLASHEVIRGTAKPARYVVIEDEASLDVKWLEQETYNLCHLYPRCTCSVSYATPAYLAHVAAAQGRIYFNGEKVPKKRQHENEEPLVHSKLTLEYPMYFI